MPGFQKRVDHALELSRYLAQKLSNDDRFVCVTQPQYTNVCFWYLPPSLRGLGKGERGEGGASSSSVLVLFLSPRIIDSPSPTPPPPVQPARDDVRSKSEALATTTKTIYARMQAAGTMLINFNPMSDHALPHFFRFVAVQPQVRCADKAAPRGGVAFWISITSHRVLFLVLFSQADKVDMDFILEEIDRLGKDLDLTTAE